MLMNKILRFSLVALMAIVFGNVYADEVTMKYTGTENANITGENSAALVGLDASAWSVVGDKGKQTNFPGLIYNANGNQIRLYWNAEGSNTITVSSLAGATINSIKITFATGNEGYKNISVTVGGNAVSGTDGAYDINSTSFVLGNANSSNVQVRFTELVINYTPAGGGGSEGGGSGEGEWTADVDYVAAPGGTMSTEFANPTISGNDKTVTISKAPVTLEFISSRTPTELSAADGGAAGMTQDNWPAAGWSEAGFKIGGDNKESQSSIQFYSVIGTGVPYISFVTKEKYTDGEPKGVFSPYNHGANPDDPDGWTYYNPDGSLGLPKSGNYVKAKATEAGVMKIGTYVQAGNTRQLYVAKESTKKVLNWKDDNNTTEYKVEGYSQAAKHSDNTWQFIPSFTVADYIIGPETEFTFKDAVTGEDKTVNILDSRKFVWFVFDVDPAETYYIFGKNWQIGFQGVKFYKGKTIKDYTPAGIETIKTVNKVWNPNAPMYNLSGQKVDKSYKGIVIQNGRKFVNK